MADETKGHPSIAAVRKSAERLRELTAGLGRTFEEKLAIDAASSELFDCIAAAERGHVANETNPPTDTLGAAMFWLGEYSRDLSGSGLDYSLDHQATRHSEVLGVIARLKRLNAVTLLGANLAEAIKELNDVLQGATRTAKPSDAGSVLHPFELVARQFREQGMLYDGERSAAFFHAEAVLRGAMEAVEFDIKCPPAQLDIDAVLAPFAELQGTIDEACRRSQQIGAGRAFLQGFLTEALRRAIAKAREVARG